MNYALDYLGSTFLYVSIMIGILLFAFIAQKTKNRTISNLSTTLIILLLSMLAGFRAVSVGKDTGAYLRAINSAGQNYSGELFFTYFEGGFGILIKLLMLLFKNPHYVLFIISLITNVLIIKSLWHFRSNFSFSFSIFLYYTLYYFETFNIMRQYLAISIIFWGIKYVLERRYFTFIMLTLLASFLHGSAIICLVFLPIHLLVEKKMLFKHKIILFLSIIGFLFFSEYLLNTIGFSSTLEKYQSYYIQGMGKNINFGFFFLIRLAIILFSIYIFKKDKFKDYKFSKFIILLNIFGTIITMGGYVYPFAGRIGTYAIIFEIILWSQLVKSKDNLSRLLIRTGLTALSLYLFYSNLKGSTQGHMPYKLFF